MFKFSSKKKSIFTLAAVGLLGSASLACAAEPLVHLDFSNETITNLGSFDLTGLKFHDGQGDAPVFVDTGINGIQAIKLDGTNYVDSTTQTQALGISGAASKTVSAIIKPDATGNYAIWSVGNTTDNQDFTVKVNGDYDLRGQQWGGDFSTAVPYSLKNDWGMVTQTYDGNTVSIYYNGQLTGSNNVAINTGTTGTIKVGYWYDLEYSFRGGIADFHIYGESLTADQIRQAAYDHGGGLFTFKTNMANSFGIGMDGWYAGCGNNMFAVQSYADLNAIRAGVQSGGNQDTATVDGAHFSDTYNGVLWGQPFTVVDDTKEISFKMAGGTFAAPDTTAESGTNISQLRGRAGMVLYDITDGKFLLDTYRCSSASTDKANELKTISLEGLKGHEVALAFVDFATAGWGMSVVSDINIPLGTGTFNKIGPSLITETLAFDFDDSSDWSGWYEVDANGNRLDTISNFRFGAPDTCNYYIGPNFITSNAPGGGWDAAVGTLRSEEFTIDGDIIEFMINGGSGGDYGFELWVLNEGSEEFEKARTAQRSASHNDFEYNFWDVSDLEGLTAFLQLRDNQNANWGWVGIDNLRMVDFNQVPEPSTWALLVLGAAGMALGRRRTKARA